MYATKQMPIACGFLGIAASLCFFANIPTASESGIFYAHVNNGLSANDTALRRAAETGCVKTGVRTYDCTDAATAEKTKKITHWHYDIQTIKATVTAYSKEEFPGKTASGVLGMVGKTIACPRSISFGSHVESPVFGSRTCMDRLAYRFDKRFDVFVNSTADAIKFGKKEMNVTIEYER